MQNELPVPPPPATSQTSSSVRATITVGAVTVEVTLPSGQQIQENIIAGQAALKRAKRALVTPGVKLLTKKGVPRFYASPQNPGLIVRELNGRRRVGKFESGKFVPVNMSYIKNNALKKGNVP